MSQRFKELPPQRLLLQLLHYEPDSGKVFWRERSVELFREGYHGPASVYATRWNKRYAGHELTSIDLNGYLQAGILGVSYRLHRLIWRLVYGTTPDEVDHIDGDPLNNRLANLRDVSHADNGRNAKLQARNSSGFCGVSWHSIGRKWAARIRHDGRDYYLGLFDELQDAVAARRAAEARFGFDPGHGRTPRLRKSIRTSRAPVWPDSNSNVEAAQR